uniref:Secreted protein n=1 Tax=Anguilla anguilla TaxID=7936 RepID=A0A0E9XE98_ANGAN
MPLKIISSSLLVTSLWGSVDIIRATIVLTVHALTGHTWKKSDDVIFDIDVTFLTGRIHVYIVHFTSTRTLHRRKALLGCTDRLADRGIWQHLYVTRYIIIFFINTETLRNFLVLIARNTPIFSWSKGGVATLKQKGRSGRQ